MKPKIILYNPKAVFFDMPLALLAIGSAVDASRYEVVIIDGRMEPEPWNIIVPHLKNAICFGVTVLTGNPLKDAISISKKVKLAAPHLPVIWGGWHASLFPEQTLKDAEYLDITVQAQGEITFLEIIESLEHRKPLSDVKGICYRTESGKIRKNVPRAMENMDLLPPLNYDLIDVERYFKKKGRRQLDFITSTGCFFRCNFCADPFVFNRKWSAISPQRIGEEIEILFRKYQFTDINFQDETFFTYPKRVKEIANELIHRKIQTSWAATMRADQGSRISDEEFSLLVKSGLRRVLIGVESGSQEMMDWLAKDIKMEQVIDCAEKCKRHGIAVIFPFIVGFPDETDESVSATVNMVKYLSSMSNKFDTPIFYYKPYPGSTITINAEKNGFRLPENIEAWSDFDYIGSKGPWVTDEKYHFFENFKFYIKLSQKSKTKFLKPVKWLADKRLLHNNFTFPLEHYLVKKLLPMKKLS